jgi:DNA-binding NarL/FixJ family response regulator
MACSSMDHIYTNLSSFFGTSQDRMTTMRRVLVVEHQRLLGAGIENMLRSDVDLEVLGVTPESESALLRVINRFQADVVIFDEAMIDSTRLLDLLEHYPALRVVLVNADDGLVRTFDIRQSNVAQATELVALIKRRCIHE